MNADRQQALAITLHSLERLNEMLPPSSRLPLREDTALLPAGNLDSLGVINLITFIEEGIQDEYGLTVSISDGTNQDEADQAWRDVGSLAAFVAERIRASSHQGAPILPSS